MNALQTAVVNQMGYDEIEEVKDTLTDVSNHGAMGGFTGFIYHTETLEFWNAHKALIKSSLADMADDLGTTALEMVTKFNCLNGDYTTDEVAEVIYGSGDDSSIVDSLAWFALETVAHEIAQ